MAVTQTKLKVTYADGSVKEVLAGPQAQVYLERHFKISMQEANRIEHVYFLAWQALHLAGMEPREFDEFLGALADVDEIGEADANPTQEGQPSGS